MNFIFDHIRKNRRVIKREEKKKREIDFLRENLQEFWTFCTYERQGVLMTTRRAKRDNKEALTMSAMCSVEWRRTRARSPSSFSPLRDEKTSTREYVDGTSNEHRPRTSYEEAARSRTVFCRGCNWACLVELPFKWITRRRARHESSLRNRSTFFGNRDDSNQSQTTRLFSDIFCIIFSFKLHFIRKKFETLVNVK